MDVLVFFNYCVKNSYKLSGLKQCPFICSWFFRAEFWIWYNWVLHSRSHEAEIKV